jgi:hypothetical protein
MARFWVDFINGHVPNFRKSPYEQIDNYVKDCWAMIVETAKWAEKDLPGVLDRVRPDVICVDNVILFPAIKRHAREFAKPWVRIISCSENEIEDPEIPPHLSGCGAADSQGSCAISPAFQPGDQADPRRVQRLPEIRGRARVSGRTVFRGESAHEPAALSQCSQVQATSTGFRRGSSSISKGVCARRRLTRFRSSRPTATSRCCT